MHTLSIALPFFSHFLLWSLLSAGGALGLLPDMHHDLVVEQHWITHSQFTSALALGQAAPGPNMILFAALLGWQVLGLPGALLASVGLLLSSDWLLARQEAANWQRVALILLSVILVVRTGLNPLWILLAGAVLGMLGLI